MIIYNVLFKGVEKRITPICVAFATEEEARDYIETRIEASEELTLKSTLGWSNNIDDYRLEDKEENSYYFVIYRQEMKINTDTLLEIIN